MAKAEEYANMTGLELFQRVTEENKDYGNKSDYMELVLII